MSNDEHFVTDAGGEKYSFPWKRLQGLHLKSIMPSSIVIDSLNERFAIPGVAQVVTGHGGLPKVRITAPTASADIYLHGAQLTSWQPLGFEEVIFLSEQSRWESGRAIRGGIPVCFPWFRAKRDDQQAPAHGFARTTAWQLVSLVSMQDSVIVTLAMQNDEVSRRWWPHEFHLALHITVGTKLKLELVTTNTGSDSLQFEEALHTYYRVGDVQKIRVVGLDGATFLDNLAKADEPREKTQNGDVVMTQTTDNAYMHTSAPLEIVDPVLQRRVHIEKRNSLSTVVWNPWKEGAAVLADLGNNEWPQMSCVEASNILNAAITLAPGEEHTMATIISVVSAES